MLCTQASLARPSWDWWTYGRQKVNPWDDLNLSRSLQVWPAETASPECVSYYVTDPTLWDLQDYLAGLVDHGCHCLKGSSIINWMRSWVRSAIRREDSQCLRAGYKRGSGSQGYDNLWSLLINTWFDYSKH